VVFGHVINTEPQGHVPVARRRARGRPGAGNVPCDDVNRLCGSGLQAIVSAAQSVMLGDADVAIGGGAESMSRGPYILPSRPLGRSGWATSRCVDMMVGALHDPFDVIHMGVTAENVAAKYGITREDQDGLALESHRRASAAIREWPLQGQIVPVELKSKGPVLFDTDEHVRHDATLDDLAKLKPVFKKENGTVTAGNASGINDAPPRSC
jgi:acetyl-CoA C-acetyltransferase